MPPRQPGRTVAKPCSSGCACGGCNSDGRPDSLLVKFSGLTGLMAPLNGTWTIPFVQDNGGDCYYDLPSTGTSPDFAIPVDIICAAGSCTLQVILFGASPHVEEYRFTCTLGDAGKAKCKGMNASPTYDSSHGAHDYGDQSAATCTVTSASAPGKMCCCGGRPGCFLCKGTKGSYTLDVTGFTSTYSPTFCTGTCDGCNVTTHKCDCTDLNLTYVLDWVSETNGVCTWSLYFFYGFDCCFSGACENDSKCFDVTIVLTLQPTAGGFVWKLHLTGIGAVGTEIGDIDYTLSSDVVTDCSEAPVFTSIANLGSGCNTPAASQFAMS